MGNETSKQSLSKDKKVGLGKKKSKHVKNQEHHLGIVALPFPGLYDREEESDEDDDYIESGSHDSIEEEDKVENLVDHSAKEKKDEFCKMYSIGEPANTTNPTSNNATTTVTFPIPREQFDSNNKSIDDDDDSDDDNDMKSYLPSSITQLSNTGCFDLDLSPSKRKIIVPPSPSSSSKKKKKKLVRKASISNMQMKHVRASSLAVTTTDQRPSNATEGNWLKDATRFNDGGTKISFSQLATMCEGQPSTTRSLPAMVSEFWNDGHSSASRPGSTRASQARKREIVEPYSTRSDPLSAYQGQLYDDEHKIYCPSTSRSLPVSNFWNDSDSSAPRPGTMRASLTRTGEIVEPYSTRSDPSSNRHGHRTSNDAANSTSNRRNVHILDTVASNSNRKKGLLRAIRKKFKVIIKGKKQKKIRELVDIRQSDEDQLPTSCSMSSNSISDIDTGHNNTDGMSSTGSSFGFNPSFAFNGSSPSNYGNGNFGKLSTILDVSYQSSVNTSMDDRCGDTEPEKSMCNPNSSYFLPDVDEEFNEESDDESFGHTIQNSENKDQFEEILSSDFQESGDNTRDATVEEEQSQDEMEQSESAVVYSEELLSDPSEDTSSDLHKIGIDKEQIESNLEELSSNNTKESADEILQNSMCSKDDRSEAISEEDDFHQCLQGQDGNSTVATNDAYSVVTEEVGDLRSTFESTGKGKSARKMNYREESISEHLDQNHDPNHSNTDGEAGTQDETNPKLRLGDLFADITMNSRFNDITMNSSRYHQLSDETSTASQDENAVNLSSRSYLGGQNLLLETMPDEDSPSVLLEECSTVIAENKLLLPSSELNIQKEVEREDKVLSAQMDKAEENQILQRDTPSSHEIKIDEDKNEQGEEICIQQSKSNEESVRLNNHTPSSEVAKYMEIGEYNMELTEIESKMPNIHTLQTSSNYEVSKEQVVQINVPSPFESEIKKAKNADNSIPNKEQHLEIINTILNSNKQLIEAGKGHEKLQKNENKEIDRRVEVKSPISCTRPCTTIQFYNKEPSEYCPSATTDERAPVQNLIASKNDEPKPRCKKNRKPAFTKEALANSTFLFSDEPIRIRRQVRKNTRIDDERLSLMTVRESEELLPASSLPVKFRKSTGTLVESKYHDKATYYGPYRSDTIVVKLSNAKEIKSHNQSSSISESSVSGSSEKGIIVKEAFISTNHCTTEDTIILNNSSVSNSSAVILEKKLSKEDKTEDAVQSKHEANCPMAELNLGKKHTVAPRSVYLDDTNTVLEEDKRDDAVQKKDKNICATADINLEVKYTAASNIASADNINTASLCPQFTSTSETTKVMNGNNIDDLDKIKDVQKTESKPNQEGFGLSPGSVKWSGISMAETRDSLAEILDCVSPSFINKKNSAITPMKTLSPYVRFNKAMKKFQRESTKIQVNRVGRKTPPKRNAATKNNNFVFTRVTEMNGRLRRNMPPTTKGERRLTSGYDVLAPRRPKLTNPLFQNRQLIHQFTLNPLDNAGEISNTNDTNIDDGSQRNNVSDCEKKVTEVQSDIPYDEIDEHDITHTSDQDSVKSEKIYAKNIPTLKSSYLDDGEVDNSIDVKLHCSSNSAQNNSYTESHQDQEIHIQDVSSSNISNIPSENEDDVFSLASTSMLDYNANHCASKVSSENESDIFITIQNVMRSPQVSVSSDSHKSISLLVDVHKPDLSSILSASDDDVFATMVQNNASSSQVSILSNSLTWESSSDNTDRLDSLNILSQNEVDISATASTQSNAISPMLSTSSVSSPQVSISSDSQIGTSSLDNASRSSIPNILSTNVNDVSAVALQNNASSPQVSISSESQAYMLALNNTDTSNAPMTLVANECDAFTTIEQNNVSPQLSASSNSQSSDNLSALYDTDQDTAGPEDLAKSFSDIPNALKSAISSDDFDMCSTGSDGRSIDTDKSDAFSSYKKNDIRNGLQRGKTYSAYSPALDSLCNYSPLPLSKSIRAVVNPRTMNRKQGALETEQPSDIMKDKLIGTPIPVNTLRLVKQQIKKRDKVINIYSPTCGSLGSYSPLPTRTTINETPISRQENDKENSSIGESLASHSPSAPFSYDRTQNGNNIVPPHSPSALCLSPLQRTGLQARKWRDLAAQAKAKKNTSMKKKKNYGKKKRIPLSKIN